MVYFCSCNHVQSFLFRALKLKILGIGDLWKLVTGGWFRQNRKKQQELNLDQLS